MSSSIREEKQHNPRLTKVREGWREGWREGGREGGREKGRGKEGELMSAL
jgi:hypothetical protein